MLFPGFFDGCKKIPIMLRYLILAQPVRVTEDNLPFSALSWGIDRSWRIGDTWSGTIPPRGQTFARNPCVWRPRSIRARAQTTTRPWLLMSTVPMSPNRCSTPTDGPVSWRRRTLGSAVASGTSSRTWTPQSTAAGCCSWSRRAGDMTFCTVAWNIPPWPPSSCSRRTLAWPPSLPLSLSPGRGSPWVPPLLILPVWAQPQRADSCNVPEPRSPGEVGLRTRRVPDPRICRGSNRKGQKMEKKRHPMEEGLQKGKSRKTGKKGTCTMHRGFQSGINTEHIWQWVHFANSVEQRSAKCERQKPTGRVWRVSKPDQKIIVQKNVKCELISFSLFVNFATILFPGIGFNLEIIQFFRSN